MEVKLEGLIDRIKREGVSEAKAESDEILRRAKEDAGRITASAKEEARAIIEQARTEALQFQRNADASLNLAGRDLILRIKGELVGMCDNLLKQEISAVLAPEFLKELILKIVDKWSPDKELSLEILVNDKDKERLEKLVFADFKEAAKNNIEIKAGSNIEKGFRVGIKGEEAHYDFSDESILEVLKEFLNPAVAGVLKGEAK